MAFETIEIAVSDGIGRLTFNRPKVLNAFDPVLIGETGRGMTDLINDDRVGAIIVSGAGRAFSAGFDIKASANVPERTAKDWRRVLETDFDFIMQFWDCPKPTIAAVRGYCVGGAFELMLACDVTVAAETARFGEPEVRFGSGIVAMLLPWVAGPKLSKEILLTGQDRLDARRMAEIGVVNHVVPDGQELSKAEELARDMLAASPESVRMTKRAINRTYEIMGLRQSLLQALEIDIVIEASGGPERAEFNRIRREQGLKAALAWRDARFKRD